MADAPRIRIGQRLGATALALTGTLDEIRMSVGGSRDLSLTQTSPWPNPLEGDSDVPDTGWVDVTAHRTGFADETKRFTVTRTRRGDSGTGGLNSALVLIYKRSATLPTVPTLTATYTFASGVSGLDNGWFASPQAGTDPLYVTAATASSSGPTDTIAPGEWAGPVIQVQSGLNNATVYLFQRTATNVAPALPNAAVTYTFASGLATGITNGWAQSLPTTGGSYRWVTTASALSAATSDAILATEWAAVALLAEDGAAGAASSGLVLSRTSMMFTADSTGLVDAGQSFDSTIQITLGGVNDFSNWTLATSTTGGTFSLLGSVLTVTSLLTALDSGVVTVTASRVGYANMVATISLSKAKRSVPNSGPVALIGFHESTQDQTTSFTASTRVQVTPAGQIESWVGGFSTETGAWYLPVQTGIISSGNFVGNPYEARFDLTLEEGNVPTKVTNALGVWAPLSGTCFLEINISGALGVGAYYQGVYGIVIRRVSDGMQVGLGQAFFRCEII